MLKFFCFALVVILTTIGCAAKKTTSSEAKINIEDKYNDKIGVATKADFIEDFGSPSWCKQEMGGGESCRFLQEMGTKWTGTKKFQKSYSTFDEVITVFAPDGSLRSFKVNAQR